VLVSAEVRRDGDTEEAHVIAGCDGLISEPYWRSAANKRSRTVFGTGPEKGKEEYSYSAFLAKVVHPKRSGMDHTVQFYLQITPCPPFLRERSPDVTTTATKAADIQLQLTTHLSTPKG